MKPSSSEEESSDEESSDEDEKPTKAKVVSNSRIHVNYRLIINLLNVLLITNILTYSYISGDNDFVTPSNICTRGVQKVRRPTQLTTRYAHHILSLFNIDPCN